MIKFIKDNIKYILTIVIFTIVCILITMFLVNKITGGKGNDACDKNASSDPSCIDLYGTYDMNDLVVTLSDYEYNLIKTKLLTISNLKDKEVEDKINDEIKMIVDKYIDDGYNYLTTTVTANFSNILSLNIYANKIHDGMDNNNDATATYLNYNLNDGSHIKFSDLFTNDASPSLIVRNAMYELRIQDRFYFEVANREMENYDTYEEFHNDIHHKALYTDDDLLTNDAMSFMNSSDDSKNFIIYPNEIQIYDTYDKVKRIGDIMYLDNYDKIAVYSRYVLNNSNSNKNNKGNKNKNSIYESKFAPKNVITCANYTQDYLSEVLRGEITSNLYVDFSRTRLYDMESPFDSKMGEDKLGLFNKAYEKYIDTEVLNKTIKELKNKANKDKNKYYYISFISLEGSNIRVYQEELKDTYDYYAPSNAISYHLVMNTYKIPIKLYKDIYYDRLLKTYRDNTFNYSLDKRLLFEDINEFSDNNPNGIEYTNVDTCDIYNFITNEKIDDLDKMFNGAITEKDLENEFYYLAAQSWKAYTVDMINDLLSEGISYYFMPDSIVIVSNKDKEEKDYLYFNEIDVPLYTIFDEDIIELISSYDNEYDAHLTIYDEDGNEIDDEGEINE